jgi:hypothetical protein
MIVPSDTLTTLEQDLARAMAPQGAAINSVLLDYSVELKGTVRQGFTVPPAWTQELMRRLQLASVTIEPRLRVIAEKVLTRDLEVRVARQAFGDAEARRRTVSDDPQLARALEILGGAASPQDLFRRLNR